jgi:hypothetical protein
MDRFSETLRDAQMRNDFHGGIRGAGAFRLFAYLPNITCGTLGMGSSKSNFGRWPSNGAKRTALPSVRLKGALTVPTECKLTSNGHLLVLTVEGASDERQPFFFKIVRYYR